MHSVEFALAAPFAQHAWSPANALDAVSSALAMNAVVIILLIVNSEIGATHKTFNLFSSMIPSLYRSFPDRYLSEPNCACARRRLSAAPVSSGLNLSAVSNSGILSRALPDASKANPRLP